jgi:hypothetical protein
MDDSPVTLPGVSGAIYGIYPKPLEVLALRFAVVSPAMHGARGGAPEGERNGNYRHGARTKEAIELRKLIRRLARGDVGGTVHTNNNPLHGVDAHFDFVPPQRPQL